MHGARFPLARKLRASMSDEKLREFASTSEKGLPAHTAGHPHRNLGKYLHPPKAKLADHLTDLRSKGAFQSTAPRGATR